jgi:ABC-type branched-subunit amino acid transport system permease subunit
MNVNTRTVLLKRLAACLAGSIVLAIMWGPQEGSQTDYGYEVRQAVWDPRIVAFLLIGVGAFLAITFWPRVVPYLTRPGVLPLVSGALAVVAGQTLMKWYDALGDGKFGTVANAVADSSGLSPITTAFFGWLAWVQLFVVLVIGGVAVVTGVHRLAWVGVALSVFAAFVAWYAHHDVVNRAGGIDHSLGYGAVVIGYLVLAGGSIVIAMSEAEVAATREFVNVVLSWRPGMPIVILGLVVGLISFIAATWYGPQRLNTTLSETHDVFDGTGLTSIALQYLSWLGWVLLIVSVVVSGAAAYLRSRPLGYAGTVIGLTGSVLTLFALYKLSDLAAHVSPTDGGTWQNLGAGGWMACGAFLLIAGGGFVAATSRVVPIRDVDLGDQGTRSREAVASYLSAPGATRTAVIVAIAFALFYPPTATGFWQSVLVSEIGIYVLLAIGLNVVVGWAGLLDLGFIAFYAIGSYTTAYLTNSLPIKPPSWLSMTPLLAIPFAIAICLLAGLALGAPTLRLRGDYLAIVTLGFGEIIRIIAVNADGVTNGSRGTAVDPGRGVNNVPNPSIHIGPINITWGLNQLQYWYLLLVFVVIVLFAFRRLEDSRIGRAWAAIREDEVAAQATGINTFRIKLLAFAIGASTSGLVGVFFASQIGFFNPDNFILNNSILVVAYVVFGGMGSLPGAMAGAALLTWLPEFLKDQVPGPDRQMWIGAVVLLMMIFRPAGLIPAKRRKIELTRHDEAMMADASAVPASGSMGGS